MSCARSVRPVIAYLSWTEFKGGRGNKALANTPWEGLGRRVGGHQSSLQNPHSQLKAPLPTPQCFLLGSALQNQRVFPPKTHSNALQLGMRTASQGLTSPPKPRSQTNVGCVCFGSSTSSLYLPGSYRPSAPALHKILHTERGSGT